MTEPQSHWMITLVSLLASSGAAALTGYYLGRASCRPGPRLSVLRRSAPVRASVAAADDEMRNAGLTYRSVGPDGAPYPDWLRKLKGKSGVYVIKERLHDGSSVIAYVGSSRAGRLYDTITRHLQQWRRDKKFWSGQFTGELTHDPGVTYQRERVTIAARVVPDERALIEEGRLIGRLKPRDNLVTHPAGDLDDVVPF